jgi:hypothetical protein
MGLKRLLGFTDNGMDYAEVKAKLVYEDGMIRSLENGLSYGVGEFEYLSLKQLRHRVEHMSSEQVGLDAKDKSIVRHNNPIQESVQDYITSPEYNHALFQVASQFNLLEMAHPSNTPEDGVGIYWSDPTQGPKCAQSTIGATLFRNYFIENEGREGQSKNRQLNGLRAILEHVGIKEGPAYRYENGYVRLSKEHLLKCSRHIVGLTTKQREDLMGEIFVGIHWGCQVNDSDGPTDQHVSMIFCSGLPLGEYVRNGVRRGDAEVLAELIQDGMQEATMLAGVLNQAKFRNNTVVLTKLGHGAFGNPTPWVVNARNRAIERCSFPLDVLQFHYSRREHEFDY